MLKFEVCGKEVFNLLKASSFKWNFKLQVLHSIEVKIKDEDVYMVLLTSIPSSFDNLVTSLESISTKDVNL
jgi:hypothetical protein